jgi:hypothetical protein
MVSKDCSYFHLHRRASFLNMGGRGNHMVKAMIGQHCTGHNMDASGRDTKNGKIPSRKALLLSHPNRKHSCYQQCMDIPPTDPDDGDRGL